MVLFPLLEPVSSLDDNGFTLISLRPDCTLPVGAIRSSKLYIVCVAITVCKFTFGALRSTFYQLISYFTRAVFRWMLDARV